MLRLPGQTNAGGGWRPPVFSTEPWYHDPTDHRCPHDAWLDSVELREPAKGARGEQRQTAIVIRLLAAYHDGWITLRYAGVRRYSLASDECEKGMGDWLRDEFEAGEAGRILHRITWCFGPSRTSQWFVEAEAVTYEWTPKAGGSGP